MRRRALIAATSLAALGRIVQSMGELAELALPQAEDEPLPSRLSMAHVKAVDAVTEGLRNVARQSGGQAGLFAAAARYYTRWLSVPASDAVQARLGAALAELYTEAGWCGYDSGVNGSGHFARALQLADKAGDSFGIANAAFHAGRTLVRSGHPDDALKEFQLWNRSGGTRPTGPVPLIPKAAILVITTSSHKDQLMTATTSLGEVFDPLGEHFENPYEIYEFAREHAPLFFSPRFNAWIVTRYEDVRAALRAPAVFSSANALRPLSPLHPQAVDVLATGYPTTASSLTSDGEQQRPFRALLTSALTPARVAALEPFIRERAAELVDAFIAEGRIELMSRFAYPLPIEVIAHIVGLDRTDLPIVERCSASLSALTFGRLDAEAQVDAAHKMLALQQLLLGHLRRRRTEPRDDGFTAMVTSLAPEQGPLEFLQEAMLITVAQELVLPGHTTSIAMIGNGVLRLLEHPEQWELLVRQPGLIGNAVEEIIRFENPVQGFLRITTQPTTLAGTELPAGAEVLLFYSSAGRDRALCDSPEVFDITRKPTMHLGFGRGVHYCPGAGLGKLQVGIALETLVRRLPGLRLSPGQVVRMRRDLAMRSPLELHVQW